MSGTKTTRRQAIRDAIAARQNPWPLVDRAKSDREYRELCDLSTALLRAQARRSNIADDHVEGRHGRPHPDCQSCDRAADRA